MKKTFKKLLIITLYIGLILVSTKVYAAQTGKTINEATNIREKASTDSETVATISQNADVEIISEENGWYKVSYKKYTGYIRKDLLEVKETSNTETTNNTNSTAENTNTTENNTSNTTTQNTNTTVESSNVAAEQNNTKTEETTNNEVFQKGYKGSLTISVGTRLIPAINSEIIQTLPENTSYTIKDVMNKWCYIETENTSGWILLSKISGNSKTESIATQESTEVSEEEKTEEKQEETKQEEEKKEEKEEKKEVTKYVSTETLNVREKPDNDAKIISQVTLNNQITVLEEVDSTWSKIKYKSITGYVASKYLSDKKTEKSSRSENVERTSSENLDAANPTESTQTAKKEEKTSDTKSSSSGVTGADVCQYAKQYLGYKYVSGGSYPSTGFDCSGFTSYVYKHFGYSLNRVSKDQINNGTAVEKSNLKQGDIVLFKGSSGSQIGHVGIYIGGNMFIHAANPSKGVITTSMSDSYYSQRYVAARRIIN